VQQQIQSMNTFSQAVFVQCLLPEVNQKVTKEKDPTII